jgi:hypothetical protein
MDILGNLYYETVCKTVTIHCDPPCCLPTDFVIAGTGCCYQFSPVYGSGSCPGLSFLWTFGDGSTSNVESPYHCYTSSGIYTVTFSAFCGMGPIVTFTKSVNVTCPPPPPPGPGSLGISYKGSGGAITVSASGFGGLGWTPGGGVWSLGDGGFSAGMIAEHYYEHPGTYEVSFVYTMTPLSGSPVIDTITSMITVNHTQECMCAPDKVLAFAGSPISCSNGSHSSWLYVVDHIGEANMDYQWMIANVFWWSVHGISWSEWHAVLGG